MKRNFKRLVRFKGQDGKVLFGEAAAIEDELVGSTVQILDGEAPWALTSTERQAKIAEVCCPLPFSPMIYGIGLNYKSHISEANFSVPEFPTVFTKPPDALNGPFSDIVVDNACRNMDYEAELCVVIGADCRNVKKSDAMNYVLGFCAGNDVSSRYWQMPERSGQQHGYSKSFDGFCPLGPILVSPNEVKNWDKSRITTKVNGSVKQYDLLGQLLFKVEDLIEHLTRATTLRAGTVIMTGTPSGVGALMTPPQWLEDGDLIEISIDAIGSIKNRIVLQT